MGKFLSISMLWHLPIAKQSSQHRTCLTIIDTQYGPISAG
jgi:hypothetical protein